MNITVILMLINSIENKARYCQKYVIYFISMRWILYIPKMIEKKKNIYRKFLISSQ